MPNLVHNLRIKENTKILALNPPANYEEVLVNSEIAGRKKEYANEIEKVVRLHCDSNNGLPKGFRSG